MKFNPYSAQDECASVTLLLLKLAEMNHSYPQMLKCRQHVLDASVFCGQRALNQTKLALRSCGAVSVVGGPETKGSAPSHCHHTKLEHRGTFHGS